MARTTIRSEDITAGQIKSADLETNVVISGDLTVDTNTLYVDSANNRVGIGTSSPSEKLHVQEGASSGTMQLGQNYYGQIKQDVNNLEIISNGDQEYRVGLGTNNGTGKIVFKTASGTTGNTERMRISATGNVGIGTSSPGSLLEVYGDTPDIRIANTAETDTKIVFYDVQSALQSAGINYNCQNNALTFFNDTATNYGGTERMRINSNGNVGIGTSSPSKNLEVNGTLKGGTTTLGHLTIEASSGTEGGEIVLNPGSTSGGTNKVIDVYGTNLRLFGGGNWTASIFSTTATANLSVQGSLSKGSGSFKIDHPLKPDTHHLVHSFVESPQANNIYRGKVELVAGHAEINIDTVSGMTEGTFVSLNREVQCFTSNESDWDSVRGSVNGNILTIDCQNSESVATVSWLVIGERQDQHMYETDWTDENGKVIVEPEKIEDVVPELESN